MSPTMKKILMLLGAAVGGYVVYTKVIKKTPTTQPSLASARVATIANRNVAQLASTDIIEDLGLSEELGSLGGKRRR